MPPMRNRGPIKNLQPVEDEGFVAELKKNWFLILIVLLVGGAVYFFALRTPPPPPPPPPISANWQPGSGGAGVAGIQLTTTDNQYVRIQDYYGRPKIVVGYILDCDDCLASLRTLDGLAAEYKGKVDVFPLMLSRKATNLAEIVAKKYKKLGIENLSIYTVQEKEVEGLFNKEYLPVSYILNNRNEIVAVHGGAGNWQDDNVRKLLDKLVKQEAE